MAKPRLETRARSRALQAVYAWDVRGRVDPLSKVARTVWDDIGIPRDERMFASVIVTAVENDLTAIDTDLEAITDNWRIDRLGAIERCVLRIAAAELRQMDTPARVVLQEAVRLAERFGSEKSAKFVNGVLDALARRLEKL
ncbi:MAG TPA: transcription antitermination factor NusB [Gemmatimonadaceae bacterium]|nr:transcription antitermination factor NusB [Gemmatimonadaceae bacterium]